MMKPVLYVCQTRCVEWNYTNVNSTQELCCLFPITLNQQQRPANLAGVCRLPCSALVSSALESMLCRTPSPECGWDLWLVCNLRTMIRVMGCHCLTDHIIKVKRYADATEVPNKLILSSSKGKLSRWVWLNQVRVLTRETGPFLRWDILFAGLRKHAAMERKSTGLEPAHGQLLQTRGPSPQTTRKFILPTTWMRGEADSSPVEPPHEPAAWRMPWLSGVVGDGAEDPAKLRPDSCPMATSRRGPVCCFKQLICGNSLLSNRKLI